MRAQPEPFDVDDQHPFQVALGDVAFEGEQPRAVVIDHLLHQFRVVGENNRSGNCRFSRSEGVRRHRHWGQN